MAFPRSIDGALRRAGCVLGRRFALAPVVLVALVALGGSGCQSQPARLATSNLNAGAVQIYLSLPLQDTPDAFLSGVQTELRERLVLSGYDSCGVVHGLQGEDLLAHLDGANALIPGTAGLHLVFVAAPIGFGKLYAKIEATIYDPDGRILLVGDLQPPQDSIPEVIFPLARPDAAGRAWCRQIWDQTLSLVLVPRG